MKGIELLNKELVKPKAKTSIGSLSEARMALARSYYSPSSSTLRAKIYAKYPELKPMLGR